MKIEIEVDGALLADLEAIAKSGHFPLIDSAYGTDTYSGIDGVCIQPCPDWEAMTKATPGDVCRSLCRAYIDMYRHLRALYLLQRAKEGEIAPERLGFGNAEEFEECFEREEVVEESFDFWNDALGTQGDAIEGVPLAL